jgi:hypothetical protein
MGQFRQNYTNACRSLAFDFSHVLFAPSGTFEIFHNNAMLLEETNDIQIWNPTIEIQLKHWFQMFCTMNADTPGHYTFHPEAQIDYHELKGLRQEPSVRAENETSRLFEKEGA